MDIFSNGNVANRSPYKASWWTQFKAVLWRSWLSVRKDPTLMKVRLLQTLVSIELVDTLSKYLTLFTLNGIMTLVF